MPDSKSVFDTQEQAVEDLEEALATARARMALAERFRTPGPEIRPLERGWVTSLFATLFGGGK